MNKNKIKCPYCKKEIFYLNNYQSGENKYQLDLEGEYYFKEFQDDGNVNDFECPLCKKVVANNEEEAKKFLGVE